MRQFNPLTFLKNVVMINIMSFTIPQSNLNCSALSGRGSIYLRDTINNLNRGYYSTSYSINSLFKTFTRITENNIKILDSFLLTELRFNGFYNYYSSFSFPFQFNRLEFFPYNGEGSIIILLNDPITINNLRELETLDLSFIFSIKIGELPLGW